jgi:hypothetical protein
MSKSKASVLDLSSKKLEKSFDVKPITDTDDIDDIDFDYERVKRPDIKVSHIGNVQATKVNDEDLTPKDIIKVRFGTFVQLVVNRDMEEVITANSNQEIIMSSNLLTELASANDRREEKKIPLVFLVGLAIGVVLTYIFFST